MNVRGGSNILRTSELPKNYSYLIRTLRSYNNSNKKVLVPNLLELTMVTQRIR